MPDYRSPCCGLPLEMPDAIGDLYCPCGLDHRSGDVPDHPNYDGAPSETDTMGYASNDRAALRDAGRRHSL